MSRAPLCAMPVKAEGREQEVFNFFVSDPALIDHVNEVRPYHLEIETTNLCPGSCSYCYASSTSFVEATLPKERVLRLIDEAEELGIKVICWLGGDALFHPDWFTFMNKAAEKGMFNYFDSSGFISKKTAKQLVQLLPTIRASCMHIDSINPSTYQKVHNDPASLQAKIKGYKTLLEAGYPPEAMAGVITVTKASSESIEETIDWFVDDMGAKAIIFVMFKDEGFGSTHRDWEPSLADFRRAVEYRAKKLGSHWLKVGSSEATMFYCRTMFNVNFKGEVLPCPVMRDRVMGSIFAESLRDIFERQRDELLFNFKIKGYCGSGQCPYDDLCFGCRATAYHYTGDVKASDPKCFLNPEAKDDYVFT